MLERRLGNVSNHEPPSLSERDLQLIRFVKPGGNWMDVPSSVPSARIAQIRAMAEKRGIVRTTYYGRLRWDQPSYTIATYYDRPGNGTNIHPWEHRTLTHREAARLQSFPDSFRFFGTKTSIKKQIGNAVPPLLAYAIGRQIGSATAIDLFAGAGGLSYGMSLAGVKTALAQELDEGAATTYLANHPGAVVIRGDVTEPETRDRLIETAARRLNGNSPDLIMGGPPCQGFSTAGWRLKDDRRSKLIYDFLDILEELRPRLFVFENVEGITSMNGGRLLFELLQAFRQLGFGFVSDPWVANAEQFGVPQMRRRVLIVGARVAEDAIPLPEPFFDKCRGRRETAVDRHSHRYPITVAEALLGLPPVIEPIAEYAPRESPNTEYCAWVQGRKSATDFLASRGSSANPEAVSQWLPLTV